MADLETDSDARAACPWALGVDDDYLRYHDTEWGVPVADDRILFEFLVLESAQAGLSWRTILGKRAGYAAAFAQFDASQVAEFSEQRQIDLRQDPGIVRNRLKIKATVDNARQFLAVQDEFGSFAEFLWRYVDGKPLQNEWRVQADCPATSPISDQLSRDLKRRGFRFVGSTTMYAYMQAIGMVNDHVVDCPRYEICKDLGQHFHLS